MKEKWGGMLIPTVYQTVTIPMCTTIEYSKNANSMALATCLNPAVCKVGVMN